MLPRALVVLSIFSACLAAGCGSKTVAPVTPPSSGPPPPHVNQPPDTWFAGSDPGDPSAGWLIQPMPYGGSYLDFALTGWDAFHGIPNSILGPDSLQVLPADRPARRTFYEVYNDRLWIRQEGDTVHLNARVVFPGGGFDSDSPYAVNVNTALLPPELQSPVYTPGPANGSPVGFRLRIQTKDAGGGITQPSETTTFPVYDPASVFHDPEVNGRWAVTSAGKAYAVLAAVDGDGLVDRSLDQRPGGAVGVADRVDAGAGSPEDVALRAKVLTFYVNHAPLFRRDLPQFRPRPGAILQRVIQAAGPGAWSLPAVDDDWLDPTVINPGGGTPTAYGAVLRVKISVLGKLAGTSRDTCSIGPELFYPTGQISFVIPSYIAAGPVTVRLRLCDCLQCDPSLRPAICPFAGSEPAPQQGTCADTDIPCTLVDPSPGAMALDHR